jgi:subtilase family serine protease
VPALAAGAEHSLGANVGPFYSSFSVWGVIDASSAVTESNEDNNRREFMVNVAAAALPDLTIENLYLDPPNPGLGGYATANILIANYGSGAAGSFQVWYQWGPDIDLNVCVFPMSGGLGAGTDTWVACSVGPFLYNYDTAATVDYYLQVDESVENNNMFGLPFYLP